MPDTVILGAGLAGLVAAHELRGEAVVYEQRPSVGGLCRQVRAGPFAFDAVPHVLHFQDASIRAWVTRLLQGHLRAYRRRARVAVGGTIIRYPFQAHLHGLPAEVVDECLRGRAAVEGQPVETSTFERWLLTRFGPGIAAHFMVPYNTKFWTVPPSALSCEWLDGLVPVPTLDETLRGAASANPAEYGYNADFWYPTSGGLGALLAALVETVPDLRVGKRIVRIDTTARRLSFADGDTATYEQILSSIPLPELGRVLDPLPDDIAEALRALRWTSVTVVHIGVMGPAPASWHWLYVPDTDIRFYRVGLPSHYAPDAAPPGCHLLSAEIASSVWRPLDRAQVLSDAISGLQRLGLLHDPSAIVMQTVVDQRYGYVVYDHRYAAATARLGAYLREQGIQVIGRFGSWRYLSIEQTIHDAQRVTRTAMERVGHDTIPA